MSAAAAKRAFDLVLSSIGLLVLAPVFAIVAVAIKLDSPGPVFFRQVRVGRAGGRFRIVKFRTMIADADRWGTNVSAAQDPRVTRTGAFLRGTFLDEAPQLFNVLKGDMSLVGPRPETPEYAALLSPEERRVFSIRPGMAGPSTLAYSRDEAAILAGQEDPDRYYRERLLRERVRADLEYLHGPSLATDARILARTARMVLSGIRERCAG